MTMRISTDALTARYACPSAPFREGASVFGVIDAVGKSQRQRVIFLSAARPVSRELGVSLRASGTAPEMHLRFTDRCLESGCAQWKGRCRVIERELREHKRGETAANDPATSILMELTRTAADERIAPRQDCPIRMSCRWAAQEGGVACIACEQIVTLGI